MENVTPANESTANADEPEAPTYEKPEVQTLSQEDVLSAVNKGSKFPARGFAG